MTWNMKQSRPGSKRERDLRALPLLLLRKPHERDTNHTFFRFCQAPKEILNMRLLECLVQLDHRSQQQILVRTAVAWTDFFLPYMQPNMDVRHQKTSKNDDSLSKLLERLPKNQGLQVHPRVYIAYRISRDRT